jgi:hypothetical protein
MNRLLKGLVFVAGCLILFGCGGQEGNSASDSEPASAKTPETTAKVSNNPFARQQQLLRDAKGVQSLVDKDAEQKKKALEGAD